MTDIAQTPNRGGAPAGNQNAKTHGASKLRRPMGLCGSELPKGYRTVKNQSDGFREMLETELERLHPRGVPIHLRMLAATAWRHDARVRLLARYLRDESKLSLAERTALLREISEASEARDRVIVRLIGEASESAPPSIWDALRNPPAKSPESFSNGSEPVPASLVEFAAEVPGKSSGATMEDITPVPTFDPRPFPGRGEDQHQPGQTEVQL